MTHAARSVAAKPAFIMQYHEDEEQEAVWFKFGSDELAEEFGKIFTAQVGKPFITAGPHQNRTFSHFSFTHAGPVDPDVDAKIVRCVADFVKTKGGQKVSAAIAEPRISSSSTEDRFWFAFESKKGADRFAKMLAKDAERHLFEAKPNEHEQFTHYCLLTDQDNPIPGIRLMICTCMAKYVEGPEADDVLQKNMAGLKLDPKPDGKSND